LINFFWQRNEVTIN